MNQTSEFDNVLGSKNVTILDFRVSDFEKNFLKTHYSNLNSEKAYLQFLTDLSDGKAENWKSISETARLKF